MGLVLWLISAFTGRKPAKIKALLKTEPYPCLKLKHAYIKLSFLCALHNKSCIFHPGGAERLYSNFSLMPKST